ncbi:MAG: FIST C-terminal domain-containing protein [Deltaproteobacteria bacterium]|nr:FIST C-terminal domain-containing protein [Deltaproteobacteria bacterium]
MGHGIEVRRGFSASLDPEAAAAEIAAAVGGPNRELVLVYCSPRYDLPALARALRDRLGTEGVIGCTTAGEIGPGGYREASISAASIAGTGFRARTVRLDDLCNFAFARGEAATREARLALADATDGRDPSFGLLLSDGLSMREESIVSSVYGALGTVPLVGGSAADGTSFGATHVLHDGEFRRDAAVLTLAHTVAPFEVFKTEHFEMGTDKLVVTGADPARRLVTEINGEPAGREFARLVGLEVKELTPLVFATHPVIVRVGGLPFVRSIQKVNADDSLTFFCAIDEGIVLTVAKGVDMADNLRRTFSGVRERLGKPLLTLGFDCLLRRIETLQKDEVHAISRIMEENAVTGFATYGEQFQGMHVNQTFTAVALGCGDIT